MSNDYSVGKIKAALKAVQGNVAKARQMLIAQAMEDPRLLKELVKPHMAGIVAHAVGRVVSGKTESSGGGSSSRPQERAQDNMQDTFGIDILKTIAGGDTAQFGQESYGRPLKKQEASQAHIDAIKQMVRKSRSNKGN